MLKRKLLEQEPSTGNVFEDLGLADAGEHLIKAGLVVRIDRIIRQRKLTQAAAAQLMGIDQPKVSAMLAGQFRGYSVERLMRFLEYEVKMTGDAIDEMEYRLNAQCKA